MTSTTSKIPKELNDAIRVVLGKRIKLFFRCPVKIDTKGDKTENKVVVFSVFRIYILAAKVPSKVELNFNYLDIQAIESKKPNEISLVVNDKAHTFHALENDERDIDQMLLHLGAAIRNIFPVIPIENVIRKVDVVPATRLQPLRDHKRSLDDKDIGPCGGFSTQYACMCDLYSLPYREEVAWDVDTIYLSHDTKELSIRDFDHLEPRDLVPIISALGYNVWFTKLRVSNVKLTAEIIEHILHVMGRSMSIEELYLDNNGLKSDFAHKLAMALIVNGSSMVHTIDLSNNLVEDKGLNSLCGYMAKVTAEGANHLGKAMLKVCKGLLHVNLSRCGLTSKGVNLFAHALSVNKCMATTLTHLNLSDNIFKEDVTNLYNFLAQPNSLTHVDLSGTEIALDTLFGALLRGCNQHLAYVNLCRTPFSHKRGKDPLVPPSFKQFFSATIALKYLNLSSTKLPPEALKNLLLGLACNENASGVDLDLSTNTFVSAHAHVLETCLPEINCLYSVDVSDNCMEADLGNVVLAISKNKAIKKLAMGRNFNNLKSKHIGYVMECLVQMIQDEDSALEYLSVSDSKLKSDIYNLINALGSNQCLVSIDISGNMMGDAGARFLAKALQINQRLRAIVYDRNGISGQGFQDLAYAMDSNYSIRYMVYPIHDAILAMKTAPDKTENALKKIDSLLHRNVSPKKFGNGQAFRLQQGFLMGTTQQMVDRLVVQTQDVVSHVRKNSVTDPVSMLVQKEEAERAVGYISDADNSKQLLARMQEVLIQREAPGNMVESKLQQVVDELTAVIENQIKGTVDKLISCAEEHCPYVLSNEKAKLDLQLSCRKKSLLPPDFVRNCVMDQAGTDILNKINELHIAAAAHLSDRIIDDVMESLSRSYKILMGHKGAAGDSISALPTPDTVRLPPRSHAVKVDSNDSSKSDMQLAIDNSSEKSDSPMATPQLSNKRKSVQTRKLRPQSVIESSDSVQTENASSSDLIEEDEGNGDELPIDFVGPSHSKTLEHLGKGRPKKMKTRLPSRSQIRGNTVAPAGGGEQNSDAPVEQNIGEGLDAFFKRAPVDASTGAQDNVSSIPAELPNKLDSSLVGKNQRIADKSKAVTSPIELDKKVLASSTNSVRSFFNRITSDKFTKSQSVDIASLSASVSTEHVEAETKSPIKASEANSIPAESARKTSTSSIEENSVELRTESISTVRSIAGLSRMGMGTSIMAEMRQALKEKKASVQLLRVEEISDQEPAIAASCLMSTSMDPATLAAAMSKPSKSEAEVTPNSSPNRVVPAPRNSLRPVSALIKPTETKVSPKTSPQIGLKPKPPPPIAPKPRPRSVAGGLDSPKQTGNEDSPQAIRGSPEGVDSVDSGVVGSSDSLESKSTKELTVFSGDADTKQKTSSLPRPHVSGNMLGTDNSVSRSRSFGSSSADDACTPEHPKERSGDGHKGDGSANDSLGRIELDDEYDIVVV